MCLKIRLTKIENMQTLKEKNMAVSSSPALIHFSSKSYDINNFI